jgi:cysteine desulfurase
METTYLDFSATTPVDPRIMNVMFPFFTEEFGNTSSIHWYGQRAEAALESARQTFAEILNCGTNEIIYTSCGSESDNLALRGAALASRRLRHANHILISPVEHPAVSRTARQLADIFGFELEFLPVDTFGMVDPHAVAACIRPDTALVSVIYANNEIGTINPIEEIGILCREKNISFHTDAVQAAAHLSVDVNKLNVDLLSIGAHKFYGPKGVGLLYVRKGTPLIPVQTGGSQEFGFRAGTHNTPLIIGMAEALRLAQEERTQNFTHLIPLRNQLIGSILEEVSLSQLTGHPEKRLPNHASFVFKHVDGNRLLIKLDTLGFACSSGSACKTGNPEPSEVLTSLGLSREWALGSLRVTLGKTTTSEQISRFIQVLPLAIQQISKTNG